VEAYLTERHAMAAAAHEARKQGWTQARIAEQLGIDRSNVSRLLKSIPAGQIPAPANVVGSGLPGWDAATERAKPHTCPRCRGILRPEDLCLACRHYPRAEKQIADELRREKAKQARERKTAARFKPRGATDGLPT
jgi:hypothetical protein